MNIIEKFVRHFADFTAILMSDGLAADMSNKNTSLWLVLSVAFIGIICLVLLGLAIYALLV